MKKIIEINFKENYFENEKDKIQNKYKLLEFLGLKDKNGQLIHFGDILIDECQNLLTPVVEIENEEHIFYFKPIKHLKNCQN